MNTDNTRDGFEPSPASAGSQRPALWALEWKEDAGRIDPEWVYGTCEEALEVNETGCYGRATVVPLYRQPQPTLTNEEREALKVAIELCMDITYGGENDEPAACVLRRLLGRLS